MGPGGYGPPPGRNRVLLVGVVVTIVVLATALVAGVLVYLDRKDEPGRTGAARTVAPSSGPVPSASTAGPSSPTSTPNPLRGEVAWQKPWAPQADSDFRPTGGWFAAGLVVRMGQGFLVAYRSADGSEAWRLGPPSVDGRVGHFCAMSRAVNAGFGAVGYGPPKRNSVAPEIQGLAQCTHVAVVDLRVGRYRWMRAADLVSFTGNGQLEFAGSVVVFNQSLALTGYSLTTGTRLWRRGRDLNCALHHMLAAPRRITVVAGCTGKPSIGYIDPANGRLFAQGTIPTSSGHGNRLAHPDPAVVLESASRGMHRYLVFDGAARFQFAIRQTGPYGVLQMTQDSARGAHIPRPRGQNVYDEVLPFFHGQGLFVTMTEGKAVTQLRDTNQIVAFDAATGRPKWSVSLGAKQTGGPAAVTAEGVIAVSNGTYENPPKILRLGLSDGQPAELSPPYPRNAVSGLTGYLLSWNGSGLDGVDVSANSRIKLPSVVALR